MRYSRNHVPKLRHHKTWGLAVVTIDGRDIYLGKHGTPEAEAEYRRVIAEYLSRPKAPPPEPSAPTTSTGQVKAPACLAIDEVAAQYMAHCHAYYVRDGKPTSEVTNIKMALRPLRRL